MKLHYLLLLFTLVSGILASPSMESKEEEEMDEEEFDEAILMGDNRKSLKSLSPQEAAEEVRELVSLIDRDGDGSLDKEELIAYQIRLTEHNNNQQTRRVFEKNDVDQDGLVTLQEMWAQFAEGEVPADDEMSDQDRTFKAKFVSADANSDGRLDEKEFGTYVHPQRHEHMIQHLIRDQLEAFDKNQDGQIGRLEYMASFNPDKLPEKDLPEWVADEKANFDYNLDTNQDGVLDESEIRNWMVPDEATMFDVEARHLFYSADTNRDRKLTAEEIQERFEVFVDSSITNNGYAVHEEL